MAEQIFDLPDEEYHSMDEYLSSGYIRGAIKSMDTALKKADPNLPALRDGRACHCRILEPERFHDRYIAMPKVDRRTKEGKALAQQVEEMATRKGMEVLSQDTLELLDHMNYAIQRHPEAPSLLRQSRTEVTFLWEEKGLKFRSRTDALNVASKVVMDLKTTSGSALDFGSQILKYGLHVQAFHYLKGIEAFYKEDDWDFWFLVVEKQAPFGVCIYRLSPEYYTLAEEEWAKGVARIEAHRANPSGYTGYPVGITTLRPPKYTLSRTDHD